MGAAHERRRQRPRAQVVQVAAVPGDQPRVLPPGDRLPHRPGRHRAAPPGGRISAARRTEATMFGCWGPGGGAPPAPAAPRPWSGSGSPSQAVNGGDEPGGAEAALEPVAVLEGLLHRAEAAAGDRQPSTVVISAPSTPTANSRQERIGRPSTSTVQAPQTPCSQQWVPVSPRSWRRQSASSRRPAPHGVRPLTTSRVSCRARSRPPLLAADVGPVRPRSWRRVGAPPRARPGGQDPRPGGGGRRRWRGCRPRGRRRPWARRPAVA